MLGNFSFGDYFKRDAIHWAWEFLTSPEWVGLEPDRLYPSVFAGNETTPADDEAFAIWRDEIGIPEDRIFKFGKEDNFWEHGSGPCGPCSEIYYDRGPEWGCGKPGCTVGCDCDRYIEVWNVVFSQFDNDGEGHYTGCLFPFGWGELWGVADRTNYDLTQHQEHSGQDLTYFDQEKNEHYIPYVVEPSLGADRMTLALLVEAYDEEVVDAEKNDVRTVMRFHPAIAPFKCAVLPLSKKLSEKAREIQAELSKDWMVDFDDTGSIGKRYRREDEIGTPYCITVDFDTVGDADKAGDNCVTVRDRDTMEQVRLPIDQLKSYLAEKLAY